jgi:rhamnosyltransferase subunit B
VKFLVFPFGSSGDVFPFVGLAAALQNRGHEVICFANDHFRDVVQRAGVPYRVWGKADDYIDLADHPDLWNPLRGLKVIFQGVALAMREQYELIRDQLSLAQEAGEEPPVVIHSVLGVGALVARDRLGVKTLTAQLQPSTFWSKHESPRLSNHMFGPRTPRWLKQFLFWIGETFIIDRAACPVVNSFRAEVGLPPIRKLTRWWTSPDGIVCLFPQWYGPVQPDWPRPLAVSQFPLWDTGSVTSLDPAVEEFIQRFGPPLVFTPGSGNKQAEKFFAAAVDACQRLHRPGLLLSPYREQIPSNLPESIRHFDFVPLSLVLPRCAALIHHGGIGTCSQGLRAGVPQLVMPMSFDQPDNAARLQRLGVGDSLIPSRFRGPAVAAKLDRLLKSDAVQTSCEGIRKRFTGVDPFAEACKAVEQFAVATKTMPGTPRKFHSQII